MRAGMNQQPQSEAEKSFTHEKRKERPKGLLCEKTKVRTAKARLQQVKVKQLAQGNKAKRFCLQGASLTRRERSS